MKMLKKTIAHVLIACVTLSLLPMDLLAAGPNTKDLYLVGAAPSGAKKRETNKMKASEEECNQETV